MARKISAGLVGEPSVGAINVAPTAVLTTTTNQTIGFANDVILNTQSDLRFGDADSSNWVAFQAPATIASNVTWTLPNSDGTDNQVLTTNGSGALTWTSKDVAIVDQTTSSTTHYVTLTTSTSGVATTLNTSSSKLSFQPSTGNLTTSSLTANGQVFINYDGTGDNASSNTTMLELRDNGTTSTPSMAFHRPSLWATKIVLHTDNQLYFGGWSAAVGGQTIVTGTHNPGATNTYDLGTASLRWRNIFTQDLHLSNGIGDYTIIEGEEELYLVNNKNKKHFKFALIEVDPREVPPKSEGN